MRYMEIIEKTYEDVIESERGGLGVIEEYLKENAGEVSKEDWDDLFYMTLHKFQDKKMLVHILTYKGEH